jgi:hypothetical protein
MHTNMPLILLKKGFCVLIALLAAFGATACMATLTPQGSQVRPVTAAQKDRDCRFVSVVTAEESMGSSTAGDAESAMNKTRNKVAAAGGNAMLVISVSTTSASTTVVAEALSCRFNDGGA